MKRIFFILLFARIAFATAAFECVRQARHCLHLPTVRAVDYCKFISQPAVGKVIECWAKAKTLYEKLDDDEKAPFMKADKEEKEALKEEDSKYEPCSFCFELCKQMNSPTFSPLLCFEEFRNSGWKTPIAQILYGCQAAP